MIDDPGRLWVSSFVIDVAACLKRIDSRSPIAVNARTRTPYLPGVGPHPETAVVALLVKELAEFQPGKYAERLLTGVAYPANARQRCDLCVAHSEGVAWAIEVKMLRLVGDNGKPNDNMLMHILSPYPVHRSALTDCQKLANSGFEGRKAILIYGFDYPSLEMDTAVDAFEVLASTKVELGPRCTGRYDELVHPVHNRGRVFGWEVRGR